MADLFAEHPSIQMLVGICMGLVVFLVPVFSAGLLTPRLLAAAYITMGIAGLGVFLQHSGFFSRQYSSFDGPVGVAVSLGGVALIGIVALSFVRTLLRAFQGQTTSGEKGAPDTGCEQGE